MSDLEKSIEANLEDLKEQTKDLLYYAVQQKEYETITFSYAEEIHGLFTILEYLSQQLLSENRLLKMRLEKNEQS
tara:strand:- start:76 stop:300 length:225 start_codon:yes stop_codon:yes gene_type:complete